MRRPLLLPAFAAALAACTPSPSAPLKTVVVTRDPKAARYQLTEVTLTTLTDLPSLAGPVVEMTVGGNVTVDASDGLLQSASSNEQLRAAVVKDPGETPHGAFAQSGEVWWPLDFHSQNLITTYWAFERSFTFFSKFGWTQAQAGTPKLQYWPELNLVGNEPAVQKDNAAYLSLASAFVLLPFDALQEVPLGMNLGVLGHEYTHLVNNKRMFEGQALPLIYPAFGSNGGAAAPANLLKSVDEGFADFLGMGVACGDDFTSCDTNFIGASISSVATARELAGKHCLDQTLFSQMQTLPFSEFTSRGLHYPVGTVFSSALWRAATDPSTVAALGAAKAIERTMKAVYDSVDDTNQNNPGLHQALIQLKQNPAAFTAETVVADTLVRHAGDPVLATAMCSALMDRLGALPNSSTDPASNCATKCTSTSAVPTGCICACQSYPQARAYGDCR